MGAGTAGGEDPVSAARRWLGHQIDRHGPNCAAWTIDGHRFSVAIGAPAPRRDHAPVKDLHPARFRATHPRRAAAHLHQVPWGSLTVRPTPAAQRALLAELRAGLEPILERESLPLDFTLEPGLRLRRTYGRCTWNANREPPTIAVRCTADGDATQWRRDGAIMGTLVHEITHLRYRSHGPRFWALHRRLVDRAAAAALYDPTDRDPAERARGDQKLANSAAWPIALAARHTRLERVRARSRQASIGTGQVNRIVQRALRLKLL